MRSSCRAFIGRNSKEPITSLSTFTPVLVEPELLDAVEDVSPAIEDVASEEPRPTDEVLHYHRNAFTIEESRQIVDDIRSRISAHEDHRPDTAVRTNYFDDCETSISNNYEWILRRIWEKAFTYSADAVSAPSNSTDGASLLSLSASYEEFKNSIEFVLLHEFNPKGFFDWHVDCTPTDGKSRLWNINVMLSTADIDYQGGQLAIGTEILQPECGDLYLYPPSYPHKVHPVTAGKRHTLVIALQQREQLSDEHWEKVQRQFEDLLFVSKGDYPAGEGMSSNVILNSKEPKHHLLYGHFLSARQRPGSEIDAAFATAYALWDQGDFFEARKKNTIEQVRTEHQRLPVDHDKMLAAGGLKSEPASFPVGPATTVEKKPTNKAVAEEIPKHSFDLAKARRDALAAAFLPVDF